MQRNRIFLLGTLLAAFAVAGCKPDYPSCETDKDCHEKEFCVARKCQQCRESSDCAVGSACNAGKCERIPGYCRNKSECPAGQDCLGNRCRACKADTECPKGSKCVAGVCAAKKPCKTENDCAQNEDCVDGFCVTERAAPPPPQECALDPVFFDFNESALTTEATARLAKDADCLKKVGRAAHAGRPHRSARHPGIQPGAVGTARAVRARSPGPAGRRRHQAVGPAARITGRQGNR